MAHAPGIGAGSHRRSSRTTAPRRRPVLGVVRSCLLEADVRLDGARAWDIRVEDERFFRAVRRRGMTGAADAYVNGWWDCLRLDECFARLLRADLPAAFRWSPYVVSTWLSHRLRNGQSRRRAGANVRAHYDRSGAIFAAMLDPRMLYSCAYWSGGATSLAAAQEAKLDLVCRKLGLRPSMRLLDIGCGWGGLVQYAAERYGASCVGVTVSPAQAEEARRRCDGLDVRIDLLDYREIREPFDRVASIGMFEHVGPRNYDEYMRMLQRALRPGGLALLHFFATSRSFPNRLDSEVDWFERNIFPGMAIPSLAQIGRAIDGRFVVEDLHNFGADYDPTLMAWHANFERAWPQLREECGLDERFRRLWSFYLLCAAGAFRSRKYQVWQIVLSQRGVPGGYSAPR